MCTEVFSLHLFSVQNYETSDYIINLILKNSSYFFRGKEWVDKGVPVDGIGFQMHLGPPNNIPATESVRTICNLFFPMHD